MLIPNNLVPVNAVLRKLISCGLRRVLCVAAVITLKPEVWHLLLNLRYSQYVTAFYNFNKHTHLLWLTVNYPKRTSCKSAYVKSNARLCNWRQTQEYSLECSRNYAVIMCRNMKNNFVNVSSLCEITAKQSKSYSTELWVVLNDACRWPLSKNPWPFFKTWQFVLSPHNQHTWIASDSRPILSFNSFHWGTLILLNIAD